MATTSHTHSGDLATVFSPFANTNKKVGEQSRVNRTQLEARVSKVAGAPRIGPDF